MNRQRKSPLHNSRLLAAAFLASFLACCVNSINFSPAPHGNFGGLAGMNIIDDSCLPGWFQCADQSRCIRRSWVCDGDDDCHDRSDERECGMTSRLYIPGFGGRAEMDILHHLCPPGRFQCADQSRCINRSWLCDGDSDCHDGSDERECGLTPSINQPDLGRPAGMDIVHHPCPPSQVHCADLSHCIHRYGVCDGLSDCPDDSDERECGLTTSINQHTTPAPAHSYVETDCNLCQAPEQQPELQPLMSFLSYHMNEILRENQYEHHTDLK